MDTMQTNSLTTLTIEALESVKGQDITELDVRDLTSVTDVMIIATGTSSRHVASLSNSVVEQAKKAGVQPLGVEGRQGHDWVLVDLGDVVVHVMTGEARAHYDLERLWSELPTAHRDQQGGATE